jgi:hypothetical protein
MPTPRPLIEIKKSSYSQKTKLNNYFSLLSAGVIDRGAPSARVKQNHPSAGGRAMAWGLCCLCGDSSREQIHPAVGRRLSGRGPPWRRAGPS